MSELKVNTLDSVNGSDEVSIPTLEPRFVKVWLNYDGLTGTIRDSYNVSSVTDNGTGNYTVTFEESLPDTNYCAVASASNINSSTGGSAHPSALTVSSVTVYTRDTDNVLVDRSLVALNIFSN